jgi:uncharacterized protein YlxP (DUF503 family)
MAIRLKQLISAVGKQADLFLPAVSNVKYGRLLLNSVGDQLEQLNKIAMADAVGTDTEKRETIYTQISIDESEGEFETIKMLLEFLFDPEEYSIKEIENAKVRIHIKTSVSTAGKISELKSLISAGVETEITINNGVPFVFFGGNGKGFGTVGVSGVGGNFSSLK